jgi:hypothetical protein
MSTKRAVCYIPSGYALNQFPVKHWIQRFSNYTRRRPNEIVLPAIGFVGPSYDSAIHPFPTTYGRNYLLTEWIREARAELGDKATIWASIILECGFLDNEAIWIRNQYLDDTPQICVTNPVGQDVLRDFIAEILALGGVDGIVLDATDCYPNSGSSGYAGISAHCFCEHCMREMSLNGFKESRDSFVGADSFLRLVLRLTDTGTSHIDPPQQWIDQLDAKSLVAFSTARQFVSGDASDLEREATRLLKYFGARVKTTAQALNSILACCDQTNTRTAVVIGSASADLSQMVTLDALDHAKAASEYWLPDAPTKESIPGDWLALQFLSSRSTYSINAFFEFVEKAQERMLMMGEQRFLKSLHQLSQRLMGNKIGAGSAYIVEKLPQFAGFVGIPLSTDDHLAIIKRLATEVTGTVLPPEVLEQFRIPEPVRGA